MHKGVSFYSLNVTCQAAQPSFSKPDSWGEEKNKLNSPQPWNQCLLRSYLRYLTTEPRCLQDITPFFFCPELDNPGALKATPAASNGAWCTGIRRSVRVAISDGCDVALGGNAPPTPTRQLCLPTYSMVPAYSPRGPISLPMAQMPAGISAVSLPHPSRYYPKIWWDRPFVTRAWPVERTCTATQRPESHHSVHLDKKLSTCYISLDFLLSSAISCLWSPTTSSSPLAHLSRPCFFLSTSPSTWDTGQ